MKDDYVKLKTRTINHSFIHSITDVIWQEIKNVIAPFVKRIKHTILSATTNVERQNVYPLLFKALPSSEEQTRWTNNDQANTNTYSSGNTNSQFYRPTCFWKYNILILKRLCIHRFQGHSSFAYIPCIHELSKVEAYLSGCKRVLFRSMLCFPNMLWLHYQLARILIGIQKSQLSLAHFH